MSGAPRMFRGSFVATGSALSIHIVGFRPSKVELLDVTGNAAALWQDTMADASAVKVVAAGTRTFITVNGITPLSDGFTLGADAGLNIAAHVVHYVAWE